jgi:hypothetical protein
LGFAVTTRPLSSSATVKYSRWYSMMVPVGIVC